MKTQDVVTIHILTSRLIKTVGQKYRQILDDMVTEKSLVSYDDSISLTFDKAKALHIQSVLEFYDVKDVPPSPSNKKYTKE